MTHEKVVSLRWKLVLFYGLSALTAISGVSVLFAIAATILNGRLRWFDWMIPIISYLGHSVLVFPLVLIAGLLIFVVAFFGLSAATLRYVSVISRGVGTIADGDLDARIPIQSNDELGRLAGDINKMASRLKDTIEEERRAERSKSELITSVSHDLRTPLTSILGYLELVDDDKYEDEVALRHYVSIAHKKAKDLKSLIDDLFEFTRLDYEKPKFEPASIDLKTLLEQLAEEFAPIFLRAKVECRLSFPESNVTVSADPVLLARLFENLIGNAVRYGSDGHYVDLNMAITVVGGARLAVVEVANYGPPIPEGQLGRIFDRFVRGEESRSRETGGAGLGLAIAKNIVRLHKGSIKASSGDGRTVFEVALPLLQA